MPLSNLTAEEQVFAPEESIAMAIAEIYAEYDFSAYSPDVEAEFQKARPRVEVAAVLGGAYGPLYPMAAGKAIAGGSNSREQSFDIEVFLNVITAANPVQHRAFLSRVRNIATTMVDRVNETKLTLLSLDMFSVGGTADFNRDPAQGNFFTLLSYKTKFSIQADAWAQLPVP